MIFKRKGEQLSLEQLREKYPEDYAQLMEQAKKEAAKDTQTEVEISVEPEETDEVKRLKAENAKLKKEKEEADTKNRIKEFGAKLGVDKTAAECINKGMSFNDALVEMVNAQGEYIKNVKVSFGDTSSEAAGVDTHGDKTDDEPSTFAEAIKLIKDRDSCSAMDAATKAQEEYKDLFDAQYETVRND